MIEDNTETPFEDIDAFLLLICVIDIIGIAVFI